MGESTETGTPLPPHVDVAIVGSGFSGIGMAVRLERAGRDYVVLERAGELGGTWRDNAYPGCRCDVPSSLYAFSFAPNPDWSETFPRQEEVWEYLRRVADRCGVRPRIRFGAELRDAAWDEHGQRWRLETAHGALTARVLVLAVGGLSEPSIPQLPGRETFAGTSFHSARWDHGHDLTGRRVAVVGTGASAIQIVPAIQPRVAALHVFQRTPPWVIPQRVRRLRPRERRLHRLAPPLQRLVRAGVRWGRETYVLPFLHHRLSRIPERTARRHLAAQVADPRLRRALTPEYEIGCKRILISNDWYPALQRPNVTLVTDPIAALSERGIVTADGREHAVDTIVWATGFRVTDMPIARRVRGSGGLLLADAWRDGMEALRGTTIAGFPNLFMLVGPNTGLGHTSLVLMIEAQIAYVMDALRALDAHGAAAFETRASAQASFTAALQARMRGTVWTAGGCASWYLDARGRNTTLWPGSSWSFQRATRRFRVEEHELRPPSDAIC